MVVVVCEEREIIKKIKFFWYFNKIYKIDNMMWSVLKSEDVKKKKSSYVKINNNFYTSWYECS